MEKQEFFVSKKKAKKSIIILGVIILGVIAWWALTVVTGGFSWFNVAFFGVIIALFLFALIMVMVKMNKNVPALTISDEGISETLSGVKDHVHSWDSIEKVGRKKVFGRLYVLVFIENAYQFIESQPGKIKRRLNSMYGQTGTPVAFPIEFIEGDADVIYNQIRAKIRVKKGDEAVEEDSAE